MLYNLNFIYSEIFISLAIMFLLIFGVFKNKSSKIVYNLTILSLAVATAILLSNPLNSEILLFNSSYKIDYLASFMKILIIVSGLFILLTSSKYLKVNKIFQLEYSILILFSILGMMIMVSANDLIVFYLGLELQSLALYVLASFNVNQLKSSEAGLKYFVLSALSSGLLLYGCSLIYGYSSSTNFYEISKNLNVDQYGFSFGLVFILVGLAFKVSAVPFHMWAPDVYEGSPTAVTLFFAIAPKIAAITVFVRFLYEPFLMFMDQWQIILIFISIASMLLGAFAAIGQKNIKRLIAYSSISHMGYALAGLCAGSNEGIQSTIIYIVIYMIMNLGLFSCLFMMRRAEKYYENIEDLSGLSKNHPTISICLLIILFSLAGIPPMAGFFAKFYVFSALIEKSMYSIVIIGLISAVISAFYYLRIIKIIYFDKSVDKFDTDHDIGLKLSLGISTLITLIYFIYPSKIIEIISFIKVI